MRPKRVELRDRAREFVDGTAKDVRRTITVGAGDLVPSGKQHRTLGVVGVAALEAVRLEDLEPVEIPSTRGGIDAEPMFTLGELNLKRDGDPGLPAAGRGDVDGSMKR